MHRSLILGLTLASSVLGTEPSQVEVVPAPLPAARYAQLREKSPFALATPDETPKTPDKTFADGWKIKGMTRIPEDGKLVDLVSVVSADARESFTLEGDKETKDGIAIASINWSPDIGKSKVTLKKGSEYAILEYDEMDMQGAPPVAPPARAAQQPIPGMPPGANGPGQIGQRLQPNNPRVLLPHPMAGAQGPGGRPYNGQPNGIALPNGAPNPQGRIRPRYIGSP